MSVLVVEDLQKSYVSPEGERQLVIDVPSFSLAVGEQVALEGESGTGKTTFLNLIAGILTADKGRITLAERDITSISEAQRDRWRAANLGYVFQTFNLLQGYSALENVLLAMSFAGKPDNARAQQLLETVGLGSRLHYRPSQLSVGQQQRVAVARALANKPKLVLADEPTGNLDPIRAKEALELIRRICQENSAALLIVSHDVHVLDSFDKRLSLGKINRAALTYSDADK